MQAIPFSRKLFKLMFHRSYVKSFEKVHLGIEHTEDYISKYNNLMKKLGAIQDYKDSKITVEEVVEIVGNDDARRVVCNLHSEVNDEDGAELHRLYLEVLLCGAVEFEFLTLFKSYDKSLPSKGWDRLLKNTIISISQ